jgi:hypothetical protein
MIQRSQTIFKPPAALIIAVLLLSSSYASALDITGVKTKLYHSYDGLVCYDCHTLHNSEDGAVVINHGGPYARLLNQPTVTDVCLACHVYPASAIFKAPAVMSTNGSLPANISHPAGDFYWSLIDSKKGHNPAKSLGVQALSMTSDQVLIKSPGGNFSIEDWDCDSCHGPHNMFGADVTAWRRLRRKVNGIVHTGNETAHLGVDTDGGDQGSTDSGHEPILSNDRGDIQGTSYVNHRSDGNPLEGADLLKSYGDTNKNVYRGGFSSFCSCCHGDFHGGNNETESADNGQTRVNSAWVRHPTNIDMNDTVEGRKYGINTYAKQVVNSQGTSPNPTGYDWRYPLAQPDSDFTVKVNIASMNDAGTAIANDRIMCLTCHKAHASKYANMTRWNTNDHAFIANGDPDFTGAASNGDNPAYGCGKCHQKGGSVAFVKQF